MIFDSVHNKKGPEGPLDVESGKRTTLPKGQGLTENANMMLFI